jgi:hypothetical protein
MALNPARIELEIGELVLQGFPAVHRHRVSDALRAELERLLAKLGHSLTREEVTLERLDAGSIRVSAEARPEAVGSAVARAVFAAQDRAGSPPADLQRGTLPGAGR